MKLSQTGMGNTKLNNIDEMYPGQSILLQTGQFIDSLSIIHWVSIPILFSLLVEPTTHSLQFISISLSQQGHFTFTNTSIMSSFPFFKNFYGVSF